MAPPRDAPRGRGIRQRATSLGGIESMIEHRASIEANPAFPTSSASPSASNTRSTSSLLSPQAPDHVR